MILLENIVEGTQLIQAVALENAARNLVSVT